MTAAAPTPDLGQAQLFLDDTWIDNHARVQRVWHQAKKYHRPVLESEYPWENLFPVAYGSVMFREGRFQMWYMGFNRAGLNCACYAESDDGLHWRKPMLGFHEVFGTRKNNVVVVPRSPEGGLDDLTVIDDPDDPDWPLKMLYWDGGVRDAQNQYPDRGYWAARSRDGIHWEIIGNVLPQWGDRFNALPARQHGKYVVYGRAPDMWPASGRKGRSVSRTESEDLRHWSAPELVLTADTDDPALMQIYSMTVFPYESLLLGGIERMHFSPDVLDVELAFSHDGRAWRRPQSRPAFLARSAPGAWDDTWVNLTSNVPLRRDGLLCFYYSGRCGAHVAKAYPYPYGAIGLATLRIDGFCSMQAIGPEGYILTPPMEWPDADLAVNADPRRDLTGYKSFGATCGELRVEVRDENNQPVAGFGVADCVPLTQNTDTYPDSYLPITWKDGRSLRELKGRRIRLHLALRDCHLFAFRAVGVRRSGGARAEDAGHAL